MAPKSRPKQSKKKLHKLAYSEEDMLAAIDDVRSNGLAIAVAAKKYQIPRSTLSDKETPLGRQMGLQTVLLQKEEEGLVLWILKMDQLKNHV